MSDLEFNLLMAAKVIAAYTLIYIFIPARITRFTEEANGFLDRLFISLTHSTILTIIIVHLLVFLKLYDFFSLVLGYLAAYVALSWAGGKSPYALADALGKRLIVGFFDMSESDAGFWGKAVKLLMIWIKQFKYNALYTGKRLFTNPVSGVLPAGVVIAAAYIRFSGSFIHASFSHLDVYTFLLKVKLLAYNKIYIDGLYPYGQHAVFSSLSKLTFMDPYYLCRFIGPLAGVLMLLSVYYFTLRITHNYEAGLIALVIYGLVTSRYFPEEMFRQTAALTQEYAAIFILPGLYFLWLYLQNKRQSFLLLYIETLAITLLVHQYAALYLLVWSAILMLNSILFRKAEKKCLMRVACYSFITGAVTQMPFGIGLLMGKNFHNSSIEMIKQGITAGSNGNLPLSPAKLITNNPFLDVALLIVFLLMASIIFTRKMDKVVPLSTVAGCSLIMYLLYRSSDLDLPSITEKVRTGMFFSLMLAVLYASGFDAVRELVAQVLKKYSHVYKDNFFKVVSLVSCLAVVYFFPPSPLYRFAAEYDAATENYLAIEREFPRLDWTIIGPPEQYDEAAGIGWHYDLLKLVREFSFNQAADPQFKIPIPTRHIFLFAEKKPLNLGRPVTEKDAEKELEPESGDPFLQYYKNVNQRAIIEARAMRWAGLYMKSHRGVSVFYEDDNMIIYQMEQEKKI